MWMSKGTRTSGAHTRSGFQPAQQSSVGRSVSAPWVSDSLAGRKWALLPKINVPSPTPWLPLIRMRGVWLRSHTLQLIINMQSLLALPQSSLQSELLIRLIKLYQISQGRSSLMLMRQPKQTPAPWLMKAAACLCGEGAQAHNKRGVLWEELLPSPALGPGSGSASSPSGSSCSGDSTPGSIPSLKNYPGQLQEPWHVDSVSPEHGPPLHCKPRCAPEIH